MRLVLHPPEEAGVAGCAGALLIEGMQQDLFVGWAYYAPATTAEAAKSGRAKAVTEWMGRQLEGRGRRMVPIVATNLNDCLGVKRNREG